MNCPECGGLTTVYRGRCVDGGKARTRSRVCRSKRCGHRFVTVEKLGRKTWAWSDEVDDEEDPDGEGDE